MKNDEVSRRSTRVLNENEREDCERKMHDNLP